MRPRGDFRHHTAKGRVFLLLAEHRFGQDGAIRPQHCRRGFIAAAFNAKDDGVWLHASGDTTAGFEQETERRLQGRYWAGFAADALPGPLRTPHHRHHAKCQHTNQHQHVSLHANAVT
jgi:hypothetical protein